MMILGFAQPSGPTPPMPGKGPRPTPQVKGAPPAKGQGPNQTPGDELLEEEEEPSEVGAVLADIMPWAMSILLHAAIVLIAILIIWSRLPQIHEEEPIIPIARLSEKPGAPLQMKTTTTPTKASSSKRNVTKSKEITNKVASKVKADMSLIGVAGGSESKASPFGTSVGVGGPFAAGFFGSGGNAKRIAYIVDASGSLMDTLPFVIVELKKSINELSEQQAFTVMFFQGDEFSEVPPQGLKPVTSEMRTRAFDWFDVSGGNVVPQGKAGNGALKAVRKALSYKPQLVFLLSDNITGHGQYEVSQAEFRETVKQANKTAQTKINTIQFLYPDPLTTYNMRPTLEMVSLDSGGLYKFVSGLELGLSQ